MDYLFWIPIGIIIVAAFGMGYSLGHIKGSNFSCKLWRPLIDEQHKFIDELIQKLKELRNKED